MRAGLRRALWFAALYGAGLSAVTLLALVIRAVLL